MFQKDKPSHTANARFCSRACASKAISREKAITVTCANCGKELIRRPCDRRQYCSMLCAGKAIGRNRTIRPEVFVLRKRFLREGRKAFIDVCAYCGWNETPCDVAHLIAVKDGGPNIVDNAIMLCPNHHRKFDMGLISMEEIRAVRPNCLKIKQEVSV